MESSPKWGRMGHEALPSICQSVSGESGQSEVNSQGVSTKEEGSCQLARQTVCQSIVSQSAGELASQSVNRTINHRE